MFDIGASLAAARKAEGLRLVDAERLTCLRGKYLLALENNDFDALPGRVYARAFLRTYAEALGLDADLMVDEFEAQVPEPEEDDFLVELPRVRRPFPVRLVALAAAALGIVGFVAWAGFSDNTTGVQSPGTGNAAAATQPLVRRPVHHTAAVVPHTASAKAQPLSIHAVTGTCWVLVRKGNASGPVLYEGDVYEGQTIHFASRVWMRLGAPWNVVVRRGAHVYPAPASTEPQNLTA